jgi:hypothetical protein
VLLGCLAGDWGTGIAGLFDETSVGVDVTEHRGVAPSMTRHESTQVLGLPSRIESLTTHPDDEVMSNDKRHIRPNDKNIGGAISSVI